MLVSVIDKVKKKTQKAGKLHQQGRHEHLRKIVEITEKYNTKEEKKEWETQRQPLWQEKEYLKNTQCGGDCHEKREHKI